jgi:hypothetical protein
MKALLRILLHEMGALTIALYACIVVFMVLLVLSTGGCASFGADGSMQAAPGEAVYHYRRINPAGEVCEVIITSARDVPGLEASVDRHCAVEVKAAALGGEKLQDQLMGLVGLALQRVP